MVDRTTVAPKSTAIDQNTRNLRDLATQVGDRLAAILKRITRDQSTISLQDLAKQVGADSWLCLIALVEAD
ncbi:hypothetical protein AB0B54_30645 [Microbispora bryophytorum]|uniref:hypothetical protein n=1 Tax=Microbispora bryophytorum TaxID=1460882 RepID=UPI00340D62DE